MKEQNISDGLKILSTPCPICAKRKKLMDKLDRECMGSQEERERMLTDAWNSMDESVFHDASDEHYMIEGKYDPWKSRNVISDEWHNYNFDTKQWEGHSHFDPKSKKYRNSIIRYPQDSDACYAGEPVPSDLRHPRPPMPQVIIDGELVPAESEYAKHHLAKKVREDVQ